MVTLGQLGAEYLEQAKKIRAKILFLRASLPTVDNDGKYELQKRIYTLYMEAHEAAETGKHLLHYYEREEDDGRKVSIAD